MRSLIVLLVVMLFAACGNRSAHPEKSDALAEEAEKAPKTVVHKTGNEQDTLPPKTLCFQYHIETSDKGDILRVDTAFTREGMKDVHPSAFSSEQHRLRFVYASKDGARKHYQWQLNPLHLVLKIPGGDSTRIEKIETEEADIQVCTNHEPWFHTLTIEDYPPKSAKRVLYEGGLLGVLGSE